MRSVRRFVDIHSHILPGIDDGAKTWEDSLKMLRTASDEGIGTIIATPHYGLYNQDYDINHARTLVDEINQRAIASGIDIKVLLGNELYYIPGIVSSVVQGAAATMAGSKYVLIEFSEGIDPSDAEEAVREFTSTGYIPIIAHVERYTNLFDRSLSIITQLKNCGALLQVNTNSITGRGRQSIFHKKDNRNRLSIDLLTSGMVDFVATDAHNTAGRAPHILTAVEKMLDLVGVDTSRRILFDNTKAVIDNEFIAD